MFFHISKIQIICIFQKHQIYLSQRIPTKLITINEGSHTKLINYRFNDITKIQTLQNHGINLKKLHKTIRYVWLKNSLYSNITFARSIWHILNNYNFTENIKNNDPIGLSFTRNRIDIYRNVHEIYYCYCQEFEELMGLNKKIWGRKYLIYNFKNYNTVIQEFFSPEIFI